jgi:excisionase family DNA binding protein
MTSRRPEQPAPPILDELLTPDEVCAILKVSKPWLYAQVQRRALPTVRLNRRRLRFKAGDIQLYIDRQYSSSR